MELERMSAQVNEFVPKQEQLIDIMPNGVVVINGNGDITKVNDAATNMLGGDLIGRAWRDVIETAFAPRADDGHEVSLQDGRLVNIAISSLEMVPGELIVLTDLTTTRNYQEAQSRQQRLAEMGEMTAHLAHQIRTPLASAMIYTEHLKNPSLDTEKKQKFINKIKSCYANIEQQIRDLLFFAKGGKTVLIQQTTDSFLASIRESCEAFEHNEHLTIRFDNQCLGEEFICHAESFCGALLNLVNNAIDANANNIQIKINLNKANMLQFIIEDDGDGMSDELLNHVMTPFYTTKAKGTGLGLAVVQAVSEVHGGRVEVSSETGRGSCFTITIPWIKEPVREQS